MRSFRPWWIALGLTAALSVACGDADDLASEQESLIPFDEDEPWPPPPPPPQRNFKSVARVGSGIYPCPSNYSKVSGCYNDPLPPAPSIRRSLVSSQIYHYPWSNPDAQRTKAYASYAQSGTQTFVLPNHRQSTDGRLATVERPGQPPGVGVFHPENLDLGFQTKIASDVKRTTLSRITTFHNATQIDPRAGKSRLPLSSTQAGEIHERGSFWDFCSKSGPDSTNNPRACAGRYDASSPLHQGDCYDQTLIWANVTSDNRWELRSLDLVLFVPKGKTVRSGSDPFNGNSWPDIRPGDKGIWVYPKSAVTNYNSLPHFTDYNYMERVARTGPSSFDWSFTQFKNRALADCPTTGPGLPWCKFLDSQRSHLSGNYTFYKGPYNQTSWNGHGQGHSFLEPATTADGRVLIIHDDTQGIMYSYNTYGACDARGWTRFKNVAMAHTDAQVSEYGFAKHPIRDTQGVQLSVTADLPGGYPWIDRKGSNLIFPALAAHDGFYGKWDIGSGPNAGLHGTTITHHQTNRTNNPGAIVVGAWTRGKMVLVDNGLNVTDWTFSTYELMNEKFKLALYDSEDVPVRAAGVSLVSSFENALNQYEVMNPISPFDVVWNVSSTTQRNAEVVFDEYLHKDALVVAHMNSPLILRNRNHAFLDGGAVQNITSPFLDNGFHSPANNGYNFKFSYAPRLQNAATRSQVADLTLYGGAFVPPVAEGGVVGKGVYLDGLNDHIRVTNLPAVAHFYVGLWVDARDSGWGSGSGTPRALLTLDDGSQIAINKTTLYGRTPSQSRAISLGAGIQGGRYFHIGLAFYDQGGQRTVTAYVNGKRLNSTMAFSSGFRIFNPPPYSSAGSNGSPCGPNSSNGWNCSASRKMAWLCWNGSTITSSWCAGSGQVCNGSSGGAVPSGESYCTDPGPGDSVPTSNLVIGHAGANTYGRAPLKAYVDELRVYQISGASEALSSVFGEFACNLAFGSRKSGSTCEQMDVWHSELDDADSDGVGTGLDYSLATYTTPRCGNSVHRDGLSGCDRDVAYGIDNKHIVANLPRPSFSTNTFCKTCHVSPSDPVAGLSTNALTAGSGAAKDDPRRQPMFWPRKMSGTLPAFGGSVYAPFNQGGWSGSYLDEIFLGGNASTPPDRVSPF